PELFRAAHPSADPVWIGIGGQPGAGKTAGRQMALRLVDADQVIPIIGDDLRPLHRSYRELMATAPLLMPERTQDAVAAWVELALEYAARERISTLVEGTFRRPEVTLSTAQRFRDAGFRTHLVAVAVPGWESRLSTVERFVHDHREGRAARWTPNEAHDAGLVGTPATLRAAAASDSPVDRISVVTRRGDVLFDQHRPDDLHGAAVALQAEQRRTPSAAVQREWELRRRAVVDYLAREVRRTSETAATVAALRADALRWESTTGPVSGTGPGLEGPLSL
ncbi:zeta toxin family protein, partial [uncultured Microbacterium sp.]